MRGVYHLAYLLSMIKCPKNAVEAFCVVYDSRNESQFLYLCHRMLLQLGGFLTSGLQLDKKHYASRQQDNSVGNASVELRRIFQGHSASGLYLSDQSGLECLLTFFWFHVSVVLSDYSVAVAVYGSGFLSCCELLEVLGCYVFEVPTHDVAKS